MKLDVYRFAGVLGAGLLLTAAGCGGASTTDGGDTPDLAKPGAPDLGMMAGDQGMGSGDLGMGGCPPPAYVESLGACKPTLTDYQPRDNMSKNDSWPACISDDNLFHPIDPNSISTRARIQAFEDLAKKLWEGGKVPAGQDFADARMLYLAPEGLDSRVQRRADIHYPNPMGKKCQDMGVPALLPDLCAGPAKILPILNDAFVKGAMADRPPVQAARIEAALLWFFYLSVLSESSSTVNSPKDIDSMWAYYGGGGNREAPLGLGRYVKAQGPGTHDRAYDGLLACRCWRNLDNEMGTAMNLKLGEQARAQLDRALLRGMALILRHRLGELRCAAGERQLAHLAFVQILGGFLDRGARERDPAKADQLKAQVGAPSPDKVDVAAAQSLLGDLFPCP